MVDVKHVPPKVASACQAACTGVMPGCTKCTLHSRIGLCVRVCEMQSCS